jgi:thioredoxin 1
MESFQELIQADTPVLVDFYADWCGPCKTMDPIIKEVARQLSGKTRVIKIDVDRNAKASQAYQIMSIPTYILFRKGQILWRHSGTIDKNSLVRALEQHLGA